MPKFPNVYVPLVGENGNAFSILGRVGSALKAGGASNEEVAEYTTEATSGDYDHLLRTTLEWVNEGGGYDEDDDYFDPETDEWEDE